MDKLKFSWFRFGVLTSFVSLGVYFLYTKVGKERLNSWLEEYFKEIEAEIKARKGDTLSLETLIKIFNLISELEDFLYNKDYSRIEQTRISLLKTDDYERLVSETIACHEKCFSRANRYIEKRLNVNINEIQEAIESHIDKNKIKILLEKTKKKYTNIPLYDKETVKKAYVEYLNILNKLEKVNKETMNLLKSKPDFNDPVIHYYILNKYLAVDTIKSKYGIDEKYFNQLLENNNLKEDEDILNLKKA